MNKDKYISLDLAKQIAEVAKEKGVELPESEYHHINITESMGDGVAGQSWSSWPVAKRVFNKFLTISIPDAVKPKLVVKSFEEKELIQAYRAYDTYELGEILPKRIEGAIITIEYRRKVWNMWYEGTGYGASGDTEPEARGKMLLYLLKNDLLK